MDNTTNEKSLPRTNRSDLSAVYGSPNSGIKIYQPIEGTTVIGLGHKARQGKDVAARALVRAVPGARSYAFSDAISAYCRVKHGMTKRDPRLLQQVGLELRDSSNPCIWIDALYWRIDEERPPLAVITGVRFPNEGSMIRQCGGRLWRIDRVSTDGRSPVVADDRDPNHPTETAMSDFIFDEVLTNVSGQVERFEQLAVDTFTRSQLQVSP
jgi:hypothetical protein